MSNNQININDPSVNISIVISRKNDKGTVVYVHTFDENEKNNVIGGFVSKSEEVFKGYTIDASNNVDNITDVRYGDLVSDNVKDFDIRGNDQSSDLNNNNVLGNISNSAVNPANNQTSNTQLSSPVPNNTSNSTFNRQPLMNNEVKSSLQNPPILNKVPQNAINNNSRNNKPTFFETSLKEKFKNVNISKNNDDDNESDDEGEFDFGGGKKYKKTKKNKHYTIRLKTLKKLLRNHEIV